MIKHELFGVGETRYALFHNPSDVDIIFPVKIRIKDVKADLDNPLYKCEILSFYDTFSFVSENYPECNVKYYFNDRTRKNRLLSCDFKDMDELQSLLSNERHHIILESINVYKFKSEMLDVYKNVTDFLFVKYLRHIGELTTRKTYQGVYKNSSWKDFFVRVRKMQDGLDPEQMKKLEEYINGR